MDVEIQMIDNKGEAIYCSLQGSEETIEHLIKILRYNYFIERRSYRPMGAIPGRTIWE